MKRTLVLCLFAAGCPRAASPPPPAGVEAGPTTTPVANRGDFPLVWAGDQPLAGKSHANVAPSPFKPGVPGVYAVGKQELAVTASGTLTRWYQETAWPSGTSILALTRDGATLGTWESVQAFDLDAAKKRLFIIQNLAADADGQAVNRATIVDLSTGHATTLPTDPCTNINGRWTAGARLVTYGIIGTPTRLTFCVLDDTLRVVGRISGPPEFLDPHFIGVRGTTGTLAKDPDVFYVTISSQGVLYALEMHGPRWGEYVFAEGGGDIVDLSQFSPLSPVLVVKVLGTDKTVTARRILPK